MAMSRTALWPLSTVYQKQSPQLSVRRNFHLWIQTLAESRLYSHHSKNVMYHIFSVAEQWCAFSVPHQQTVNLIILALVDRLQLTICFVPHIVHPLPAQQNVESSTAAWSRPVPDSKKIPWRCHGVPIDNCQTNWTGILWICFPCQRRAAEWLGCQSLHHGRVWTHAFDSRHPQVPYSTTSAPKRDPVPCILV